jgi:DNA-binding MarR family transcriptional regulator
MANGPSRRSTPRVDYETLADLRYHIRRFLRVREEAARAAGVEPQQYLLILQVKGFERRQPATIGALTERLQIRHHATVQLVDRLVQRGMVRRRRAELDRRGVVVELTSRGEAVLRKLALYSLAELRTGGPALASTLTRVIELNGAGRPGGEKAAGGAEEGSRMCCASTIVGSSWARRRPHPRPLGVGQGHMGTGRSRRHGGDRAAADPHHDGGASRAGRSAEGMVIPPAVR